MSLTYVLPQPCRHVVVLFIVLLSLCGLGEGRRGFLCVLFMTPQSHRITGPEARNGGSVLGAWRIRVTFGSNTSTPTCAKQNRVADKHLSLFKDISVTTLVTQCLHFFYYFPPFVSSIIALSFFLSLFLSFLPFYHSAFITSCLPFSFRFYFLFSFLLLNSVFLYFPSFFLIFFSFLSSLLPHFLWPFFSIFLSSFLPFLLHLILPFCPFTHDLIRQELAQTECPSIFSWH